jgi:hypothetical protein
MSSSYPTAALPQPSRVEQLRVLAAIHGDIGAEEEDLILTDEAALADRMSAGTPLPVASSADNRSRPAPT